MTPASRLANGPTPVLPQPRPRRLDTTATPPVWQTVAQRWLRRAHLYSGLALLPFVLVYGISAFLFNHARGVAPAPALSLPVAVGIALKTDEEGLARAVAADLHLEEVVAGTVELAGAWVFEFQDEKGRQRLHLRDDAATATLQVIRSETPRSHSLPPELAAATFTAAEQSARAILAAAGREPQELRRVSAPNLRWLAGAEQITADLNRRSVTTRPTPTLDIERLLTRLHVTHGYETDDSARLVWAVVVDAMAAAMVLWSFSGLVMWWQKRGQRRVGLLLLASTTVGAVTLCFALARAFR